MTERDGEYEPRRALDRSASLFCRVGTRVCALPLDAVLETMRPQPIEPIAGAPGFVSGLSIIRGEAVPVIALAGLLGVEGAQPRRFVTLRGGRHPVAIAVDDVLGVRPLEGELSELTPLAGAVANHLVRAIGTLDAQLLFVLETARLVPDAVFDLVEGFVS